MDRFRKTVELAANIAIVTVAILLCATLLKNRYATTTRQDFGGSPAGEVKPQEKINLPDVDWQKSDQTLLLVLSTTCHYCSESTAFYQQLVKERSGNTRIVAALPQDLDESQDYLKKHGLSVDDVKQVNLNSIGVSGTPTLILVNNDGAVKDVWVGKLPKPYQAEVLRRVQRSVAQREGAER
jgi:hypothetical protein